MNEELMTVVPLYSLSTYYNKTGDFVSATVTFQAYNNYNSFNVSIQITGTDFEVENLNDKTNKQIEQKAREKAAQLILGV